MALLVLGIEPYLVRHLHRTWGNLSDFFVPRQGVYVCLKVTVFPLFADVKKVLDSISSTIKNVSQSIPIEKVLSQVSRYVNDSNNYFHQELPKLEEYDSYW